MSLTTLRILRLGKGRLYPRSQPRVGEWRLLAQRQDTSEQGFGKGLAKLRKNAGNSQQMLADEIGVSGHTIAYYERETELLPDLSAAPGLIADALLGITSKSESAKPDQGLRRRKHQVEKVSSCENRQNLELIDHVIQREQLRLAKD